MGREVKRVPVDFDWTIGKVWPGYQNPYYTADDCLVCNRTGYSKEAKRLRDQWYGYVQFDPQETGSTPFTPNDKAIRQFAERHVHNSPEFYGTGEAAIVREAKRLCELFNTKWCYHIDQDDVNALLESKRLWDLTHDGYIPTPREVNEWNIKGFGHDSSNSHICIKAKCERLGYPYLCANCDGSGEVWPTQAEKWLSEEGWQRIDPPTGEGWQLWETTTEGAPISPVFESPDALAVWMSENRRDYEGPLTPEQALNFINVGYAPSLVMTVNANGSTTVTDGVSAIAQDS